MPAYRVEMTSAIGAGAVDLGRVAVDPALSGGSELCKDCDAVPSEIEPALALPTLVECMLPTGAKAFFDR
jgi:hypothetical protein